MLIDLPFSYSSNPGRHPHAGVARLVNCYASAVGDGQRAKLPIYAREGQPAFATHTGAANTRRMLTVDNQLYVVNNRVLSVFDTLGTETVIGGIPSDGMVTMARNRKAPHAQIGIVCDGLFYLCTNNVLTAVSDPDLLSPIGIAFMNGYFILANTDGRFQWTAIDEGSDIDALDFASAEGNPDGLVNVGVSGDDLVLTGPRSTEFHRMTTDPAAPFARATVRNFGCLSARSMAEIPVVSPESISDTLGWVASDRQGRYAGVILLDGYQSRKISNDALDEIIRNDPNQGAIEGTAWSTQGHGFYALSGTDWTWVFDTATGLWHERETYGQARWDIVHVVDFAGMLIGGSRSDGALVTMDATAHSDGDDPIVMTLQTSPAEAFPDQLEFNEVFLNVATGVGITGGDNDPQMIMQWTENGTTWSAERWRGLGAEAQTGRTVSWTRLGTSRGAGRSFRFRCSASVVRGVFGAKADAVKVPS